MEIRGQDSKEIEIPTTTTTYNLPSRDSPSSSSKLSSPTLGERSSSENLLPPPPPPSHNPHQAPQFYPPHAPSQSQRLASDPDLSTTPLATSSNPPRATVRYKECLRNHAASMGSHVVDGCGEFMASGQEGTPESLRCAACDCHRNFHRKEVEGESQPQLQQLQQLQHHQQQHVPNYYPHSHGYYNTNKHNGHLHHLPLNHHRFSSHVAATTATTPSPSLVPPVMMAFGGPAESSSEDLNMFHHNNSAGGAVLSVQQTPLAVSKKRFRTKFSQQQKDRMMEFAEKIGWKIQKSNEQEVQQFCSQIDVKRQVFKVWMHNNKQTVKKQQM